LAPRPTPQGKVVAAALTAVVAGKGLGQRAYLTRHWRRAVSQPANGLG